MGTLTARLTWFWLSCYEFKAFAKQLPCILHQDSAGAGLLSFTGSPESRGAHGLCFWVLGSGAGAAQPTLLQCSSAFHWLTLQLWLYTAPLPLKNTHHWESTGWDREGTAGGLKRGRKMRKWLWTSSKMQVKQLLKSFRHRQSHPQLFPSYMIMCRSTFFSSLSICLSFPPTSQVSIEKKNPNTHRTATADLVFLSHTLPTHTAFACALIFFIQ